MLPILRPQDIAVAVRLTAEVSSLRGDPVAAASHLLDELVRITGSMRGGLGRRSLKPGIGNIHWTPMVYAGITEPATYAQKYQILRDPLMRFPDADFALAQPDDQVTYRRADVPTIELSGRTRELHESMLRLVGEGDHLKSMSRHLGDSSYVGWLWLARSKGDARFSARCGAMVNLIMHEIGPWLWPKLRRPLHERAEMSA